MPRVLNKTTDTIPEGAVYVGRPSKWGNPFSHKRGTLAEHYTETKEDAILAYADMLASTPHLVDMARKELKGKDLVCWCRPRAGFRGRLMCHAQVLFAVANSVRVDEVE